MDAEVDLPRLAAWMDGQSLGSGPLNDCVRLAGGTQNILLRFSRSGEGYVLRRPPIHQRSNSNDTMRREARLLAALKGTQVPHPRFIAVCEDESVLGAVFYLMAPIDGFNPVSGLPPLHAGSATVQHRMGLAVVEGIAALGALDYRKIGLEGFGRPENYLERQVSRWKAQLSSYAEMPGWTNQLPGVDAAAAWLEANRPNTFSPGVIHGDYHLANVMFQNDSAEIAAIVDWELATIGDPLIDLGWLLATWPEPGAAQNLISVKPWIGFPRADELVAHYAARSARDLSAMNWYAVLACYKLGILLEGTHARACAGKAPRETGDLLHGRAVRLFERAQRFIG
ncbi:probable phosphotransferase [alpha proteobacterium U9-1i]|nr:probable phosphotransferase [alpha proteobacterium U9-1i]